MNTLYSQMKLLVPIHDHINYDQLTNLFPSEIKNMNDTMQDEIYHAEGNVWIHTKMVCDYLITLDEYKNASNDEKFILFYSCLFHDIGKPATTKLEDGKLKSKGHSKYGAIMVRKLLWNGSVPFLIREKIVQLIINHQVPFFLFDKDEANDIEYQCYKLSYKVPIHLLCTVALADIQGRICKYESDKQLAIDNILLLKEFAIENECYYNKKQFADNHSKVKYFKDKSIWENYSEYKEKGSFVYLLCGLPATGKSTWAKKQCRNLPVVSYDKTITEMNLKYTDNLGTAIHKTHDYAKELLRNKKDFVWDSTNLSLTKRTQTIDLLLQYNATVHIIYTENKEDIILRRNNNRDTSLPNDKIKQMFYKLDVPTSDEAHELTYVPCN